LVVWKVTKEPFDTLVGDSCIFRLRNDHRADYTTAAGAIELGSVKLAPREDAAPMMLAYAVSWRRENSTMKVVLDYFAPVTI